MYIIYMYMCIYICIYIYVDPSHTDESWEGRNTCLWILQVLLLLY